MVVIIQQLPSPPLLPMPPDELLLQLLEVLLLLSLCLTLSGKGRVLASSACGSGRILVLKQGLDKPEVVQPEIFDHLISCVVTC